MKNDQKEKRYTVEYDRSELKKSIIKSSVISGLEDTIIFGILLVAFKVIKI